LPNIKAPDPFTAVSDAKRIIFPMARSHRD
jgi:hypothetical protein